MPIYARSHAVSAIAFLKTGSVQTMLTAALAFVPVAFVPVAASAEAMLARGRPSVAVATVEETEPVVEMAVASN